MPMLRNLIEEIGTTRSLVEDLEDSNKNLANIKIERKMMQGHPTKASNVTIVVTCCGWKLS